MIADWANNSWVHLTILILRAHVWLQRLWEDPPSHQSLYPATPYQFVRTEEASWEVITSIKKNKKSSCEQFSLQSGELCTFGDANWMKGTDTICFRVTVHLLLASSLASPRANTRLCLCTFSQPVSSCQGCECAPHRLCPCAVWPGPGTWLLSSLSCHCNHLTMGQSFPQEWSFPPQTTQLGQASVPSKS